ncbi:MULTISPECIES: NUDIX domain-containing protein [Metabacillus]|uniref:NUDIX domain-containing protein n=1 Tax=Metabacillus TaxID=2675233 RepID=UPI0004935B97|nr:MULTISPECIES: NUDIX domain-containing protein [Metabacillus]KEZ50845.1 DNA mismatch repair protein MutT [Metabacillus indicus LMG 22858]
MFIVNAEGAVFKEDKWLIIERSMREEHAAGLLSLPGGKTEKEGAVMDILENTVKREVEEETDVVVKDEVRYVHSASFESDDGFHVVNIVFLCEYKSGTAHPKSEEEVSEAVWMTAEEIFAHPNAPVWLKTSIRLAERKKAADVIL